jgi:hypothetical protein
METVLIRYTRSVLVCTVLVPCTCTACVWPKLKNIFVKLYMYTVYSKYSPNVKIR